MDVSFINHFIESTANVFNTMLDCPVTRKSLALKNKNEPTHEVSAIIGLSGKHVGSLVFSLSRPVAFKCAERLLLVSYNEVNAEVVDAVGELSNMIAGGAKAQMPDLNLSLGLPNVVVGKNQQIYFPGDVTPISVGFQTPWGEMAIDVGFDTRLGGDLASVSRKAAVC